MSRIRNVEKLVKQVLIENEAAREDDLDSVIYDLIKDGLVEKIEE